MTAAFFFKRPISIIYTGTHVETWKSSQVQLADQLFVSCADKLGANCPVHTWALELKPQSLPEGTHSNRQTRRPPGGITPLSLFNSSHCPFLVELLIFRYWNLQDEMESLVSTCESRKMEGPGESLSWLKHLSSSLLMKPQQKFRNPPVSYMSNWIWSRNIFVNQCNSFHFQNDIPEKTKLLVYLAALQICIKLVNFFFFHSVHEQSFWEISSFRCHESEQWIRSQPEVQVRASAVQDQRRSHSLLNTGSETVLSGFYQTQLKA